MQVLTHVEVHELAEAIAHPEPKSHRNGGSHRRRDAFPQYGFLVRFIAYTGLRAGEAEALRVGRLDLLRKPVEVAESVSEVNGRLVFSDTKSHQKRSVPMPDPLVEELSGFLGTRPAAGPSDILFTAPRGGPLRHRAFYERHFKPAVRQAGLPTGLRFHDLRHTYAGFLIAEGTHARGIMERMGHSSITVTLNTYGHLLPGLEQRVTDALSSAWREAQRGPSSALRYRAGNASVSNIGSTRRSSR